MIGRLRIEKALRSLGGKYNGANVRYVPGQGYFAHLSSGEVLHFRFGVLADRYVKMKQSGSGNIADLRIGAQRDTEETI